MARPVERLPGIPVDDAFSPRVRLYGVGLNNQPREIKLLGGCRDGSFSLFVCIVFLPSRFNHQLPRLYPVDV